MGEEWLSNDQRFHYYVLDEAHDFVLVAALGFEDFQDGVEGSLVATFATLRGFVFSCLICVTILVDCVVGEVHEQIIHVFSRWFSVGLSAESSHPLLMNVDSEGIYSIE